MGNKGGSARKLDNDSDSGEESAARSSSSRKSTQTSKGCETEPPGRRRSSAGNGDSSCSSTTAASKKKSSSLLTEHQKQLISRSWKQHVNRHSTENIGVRILFNVFDLSPEIKQLFGYEEMTREALLFDKRFQKQAKAFVRVIDEAVRDIENLEEEVQKRLHALGARHVRFRSANASAFKMQQWDTFAEAMLESIIDSQRGVHKYRDTTATWRIFITWITGIMKQGYYETLRAERRATSVGLPPPHPPTDQSANARRAGALSVSAPEPGSNAAASNYYRAHSTSYAHSDLVRQFHPTPPSTSQAIPQRGLETAPSTSRSAPHSPYGLQLPSHYPTRSGQPSVTLQVPYQPYPKRSLASDVLMEQQHLMAPRPDPVRGQPYRDYEYPEEEYEYEDDAPPEEQHYPNQHYYSDYY